MTSTVLRGPLGAQRWLGETAVSRGDRLGSGVALWAVLSTILLTPEMGVRIHSYVLFISAAMLVVSFRTESLRIGLTLRPLL